MKVLYRLIGVLFQKKEKDFKVEKDFKIKIKNLLHPRVLKIQN